MPDEITYDRVEEAEENLGKKIDELNTLPEDVQEKLDEFKKTIDELKKNVEDTLADVQKTVENSPAGIPAPCLAQFSAQSTDEGILLTYNPFVMLGEYTTQYNDTKTVLVGNTETNAVGSATTPLTITKGVMVRYSTESYPFDIDEGTLAFVDEDLYDRVESGSTILNYRKGKVKSSLVVGLSQNETYYFSAFPYSDNNVYNKQLGQLNTTSCQWTGTKGTLTINIAQDYTYKTLGEYTATMTPTAGGEPIIKTQSGSGNVVFSGLEAGQYTLSFSSPQYFAAPQSQSVTVVAGQSQIIEAKYILNVSLSDLTMEEIQRITRDGNAKNIFSVGDKISVTYKYIDGTIDSSGSNPNIETEKTENFILSHFNLYENASGSSSYNTIFLSEKDTCNIATNDSKFSESYLPRYLGDEDNISKIYPEIFPYMVKLKVPTLESPFNESDFSDMYVVPLSLYEVGISASSQYLREKKLSWFSVTGEDLYQRRAIGKKYGLRTPFKAAYSDWSSQCVNVDGTTETGSGNYATNLIPKASKTPYRTYIAIG